MAHVPSSTGREAVRVPVGDRWLHADLTVPPHPTGIVLFAHGSGSSRHSPRNQYVARVLNERGLSTLLADLLTPEEEAVDIRTAEYRFDIALLAERLASIVDWLRAGPQTHAWAVGLFGASTGAGAALVAAASRPDDVQAVVSRGGRPDLAGAALRDVKAPTLLIVGGLDAPVIKMNEDARRLMHGPVAVEIVPGATHLFEEPGTLERVSQLAGDWFARYLGASRPAAPRAM
jgi:dienelactone hydrolase